MKYLEKVQLVRELYSQQVVIDKLYFFWHRHVQKSRSERTGDHALRYHMYLIPQRFDLKDWVVIAFRDFLIRMKVPMLLSVHVDEEPIKDVPTKSAKNGMRR